MPIQSRKLVLASASPRRKELLAQLGLHFEVRPTNLDETQREGEVPSEYAKRLASSKALLCSQNSPDALALGADTIVVVDDNILGKPLDNADATRMLSLLQGRTHQVITALALATFEKGVIDESRVTTSVAFAALDARDIEAYVESGEGRDKAGAYAIQGLAGGFVTRIEGSYSNVVGLPLTETVAMLRKAGVLDCWP